ncbi:MmcQ/YjbR family DNA-binding protein [[Brevibacterium] frigoritolerans]|nr:MmcQ/YjbR family DNA-binding protein [Peribacillus frigoritolerans]
MESRDKEAMLDHVRNICLALPEAVEHIDGFGHNTFKINGKSFVISGESEKGFSLSFKSDRELKNYCYRK